MRRAACHILCAARRLHADQLTDAGIYLVPTAAIFTVRRVCEQTLVPWTQGSPLGGFSIIDSNWDLLGVSLLALTALWAVVVLMLKTARRWRLSATDWVLIIVSISCCGLWLVPYEQWKLLTVRIHGPQHVPKSWIVSAAATGELELLDYLLARGINVNTRTSRGESSLGAAAAAGQIDSAARLLARGAYLENRTSIANETPLIEAARTNRIDMVNLLLEHGANRGARDALGRTALDWARANRDSGLEEYLQSRTGR